MQISAKLIQALAIQTGHGKNGEWRKQNIIVQTLDQYPKKICLSIWGDKINQEQLVVDTELLIDFDIESREHNGKWYTELKAWKISAVTSEGFIIPGNKYNLNLDDEILPF